ncbi:MAG: CpsB/CapC family capsule biosynthesis tyrosine phosphatase [Negativibacillus sp.]|nr:CpsB/CapC family capsule biosynthesis tyrosine phosphatase [Negativibacillus sp.]
MIDFHAHILPKMDDGSKSAEESIAMLKIQAEQGIRCVVATPHFYAEHETPQDFLHRREHSYQSLQQEIERQGLQEQLPQIRLGAEVRYFEGISRSSAVHDLKIEKTDLLLLEMPFVSWSQRMIQEVKAAQQQLDLTILLAHVERYRRTQGFFFHKKLEEMGALIQSNAEFFLNKQTRKKAMHLFEEGKINLLGSDCHNCTVRPPNLGKAIQLLTEQFGDLSVRYLQDQQRRYMKGID